MCFCHIPSSSSYIHFHSMYHQILFQNLRLTFFWQSTRRPILREDGKYNKQQKNNKTRKKTHRKRFKIFFKTILCFLMTRGRNIIQLTFSQKHANILYIKNMNNIKNNKSFAYHHRQQLLLQNFSIHVVSVSVSECVSLWVVSRTSINIIEVCVLFCIFVCLSQLNFLIHIPFF